MSVRVKLCGMRTEADAVLCVRAGAQELGVIFAPSSKRRVSAETARKIRGAIPAAVPLVGVFNDASSEEIEGVLRDVDLSAVQLHGSLPRRLPSLPIYVAVQVSDSASLERLLELPFAARVLLDSPRGGGSGSSFPWLLTRQARAFAPRELFIAGGLTPQNVAAAIELARPDGVDVASGIELPDGSKGEHLVRAFMTAAKEAA
jgi:phosphoribosylanthranilate isomerase